MIAVAALSARVLAECAHSTPVAALDCFGDLDTRRAAARWWPIGAPDGALRIDGARLLAAFDALAGEVQGWVAGSGFEGQLDLLDRAAQRLPLFGTAPADVRRLRDPAQWFATLRELKLPHPAVQLTAPDDATGWLRKDAGSCGGTHVSRTSGRSAPATPQVYWQREQPGTPMSATYIANGRDAVVLGINRQLVRASGRRPYLYAGIVGPVTVAPAVTALIDSALRGLVAACALRGLGSLDLLLDEDDTVTLLEVNARPPASATLYRGVEGGLLAAHLRACREGVLPAALPRADSVRGEQIVYASAALVITASIAAQLAAAAHHHDLPPPGTRIGANEPLCSVSAQAADAGAAIALLAARSAAVLDTLPP